MFTFFASRKWYILFSSYLFLATSKKNLSADRSADKREAPFWERRSDAPIAYDQAPDRSADYIYLKIDSERRFLKFLQNAQSYPYCIIFEQFLKIFL